MLAAGVAHEIRNPLTAIKAWLFIQQKHLKSGTPEYTDAGVISNEITRLENLVKDVLLFARPSEPHFTTASADEPLRQVQSLLRTATGQEQHPATPGRVAVPARIRIDATADPAGAHQPHPECRRQYRQRRRDHPARAARRQAPGDRSTEVVILEVTDTGKGIPPEVQKRLFDPFFTTKEGGTGLGLSIASRILEKHGGALQYQTQMNRGTTFGIVLPRVQEKPTTQAVHVEALKR